MLIVLSISFCGAQSIQEAVKAERERKEQLQREAEEQKKREEQQRKEAQRLKREAEDRRLFELEQSYQNAIKSAENNYIQGQYAKAKQDYTTALGLKPAEANTINPKIAKIRYRTESSDPGSILNLALIAIICLPHWYARYIM